MKAMYYCLFVLVFSVSMAFSQPEDLPLEIKGVPDFKTSQNDLPFSNITNENSTSVTFFNGSKAKDRILSDTSNIDSVITYSTNFDNGKYIYSFDINSNTSITEISWFTNNAWIRDSRELHSYDSIKKVLSHVTERWKNNKWIGNTKGVLYFNNNEKVYLETSEKYDTLKNNWVILYSIYRTFDINDNVLSSLKEDFKNEKVFKHNKETTTVQMLN